MLRMLDYLPCLPTRGTKGPTGPDWIHNVKHDCYRSLVARKATRSRLFSRNGHDWTERYPWIVEAALKNRQKHFVVDGEAVLLGTAFPISTAFTLGTLRRRSSFTPSISWRSTVRTFGCCR